MNFLLLMENITTIGQTDFCENFSMLWTIVGYAIFAIKVVVPIILIVSGMITLAKAVADGSDDKKKDAQKGLFKKIGYAVAVFLVIQIVSIVIGLVSSGKTYESCAWCAFHPFNSTETKSDGTTVDHKCGVQKSDF